MNTTHYNLKLFARLLTVIILFQSCNIYRSTPVSIDRAVEFNRKVKIKTQNNQVYKFNSLEREGTDLFGIAKANSKEAKLMAENIVEKNYRGKFVKIGIAENSVQEVKLKNYTMSVITPIVVGLAVFVGLLAFIASQLVIFP